MPNITCSHKILNLDNTSKNAKCKKKIFLILNSTLDEISNDTTHISLRWLYRNCVNKKKPIWVYSSYPHKWGRNKKWIATDFPEETVN